MPKQLNKEIGVVGVSLIAIYILISALPTDVGAHLAKCQMAMNAVPKKNAGEVPDDGSTFLIACMRSKGYVFEKYSSNSRCWSSQMEPFFIIEQCYEPYSWLTKVKGLWDG